MSVPSERFLTLLLPTRLSYQPWLGRLPAILHYGTDYKIPYQDGKTGDVYFNKMSHQDLAAETCPGFLFGAFTVNNWGNVSKRDALAIEHLAMLDGGLCRFYKKLSCPTSDGLKFCEASDDNVHGILEGVRSVFDECKDEMVDCARWSATGECKANPLFMYSNCAKSCGTCGVPTVELFPEEMHLGDWRWSEEQKAKGREEATREGKPTEETAAEALAAAELLSDAGADGELVVADDSAEPVVHEASADSAEGSPSTATEVPTRPMNPRRTRGKRVEQAKLYEDLHKDARDSEIRRAQVEDLRASSARSQRASAKAAYNAKKEKRNALSAEPASLIGPRLSTFVGMGLIVAGLSFFLRRLGVCGKRHPKKLYEDKCAV